MGRKKSNEDKSTKDEKKAPITTLVKDAEGTEYHLRPLRPNTDVDFYKIYLSKFSRTLDGIMNQKMKLVLWLIRKMTLTNELKYSYREIARLSGISYQTVAETIKTLIEDDFMRRNDKTLMVNPNAVFRGRLDLKTAACKTYNKIRNQPEKEDGIRVLGFDVQVLLHHRGDFRHGDTFFLSVMSRPRTETPPSERREVQCKPCGSTQEQLLQPRSGGVKPVPPAGTTWSRR